MGRIIPIIGLVLLFSLPVVAGCKSKSSEESKTGEELEVKEQAVSATAQRQARQIFAARCVSCHGPRGKGNGPASAALDPKPRDFTDAAWQNSVADEYIEKIIVRGGAAVGKSASMPPNPDLEGKEEVVKALRMHVRRFRESVHPAGSAARGNQ